MSLKDISIFLNIYAYIIEKVISAFVIFQIFEFKFKFLTDYESKDLNYYQSIKA